LSWSSGVVDWDADILGNQSSHAAVVVGATQGALRGVEDQTSGGNDLSSVSAVGGVARAVP
jgi:hypothetical protein